VRRTPELSALTAIRVAVVEEHEIFRRGTVACLTDDPLFDVVFDGPSGPLTREADVAVVSHRIALEEPFGCPLVVCSIDAPASLGAYETNAVLAVLPRSSLTAEQLAATVRAAAAGLRVEPRDAPATRRRVFDDRSLEVLRMLSRGADTHQISRSLSYSERTVKALISDIQRQLGARNRTHAVAEGIRHGFI
jgi:DNA-binding CsgD family transcriptional regulator